MTIDGVRDGTSSAARRAGKPWIPHPRPGRHPVPDLRPRPGHDLLAGIDTVLPRLTSATEPPAPRLLADDLKAALARTAACGDTCRVRAAADAVRLAAELLLAGSAERARPVLQRVRAELAGPRRVGDKP
jgi:hypothetical protein